MSDQIGRIAVPTVINSGQTFPFTTQYPFGFSVERPVIVHRFGSLDAKQEQRYYVGIGPRKFQFKRPNLGWTETNQLKAFWEAMQGPWKAFTYNVPNPGGTTTGVLVTFEQTPISFEYLRNAVQVGLNLIEVVDPAQAPTYAVNSTCLRFPSTALSTALLSEVQQIVPLVHIRVRESSVADIYLSDRRVTVGGQLYLPRLIGIGEPGSDVLISQDIKGTSDNVRFTFGNGDRVMTQLANDTDLKYAEIDLCLFHVNSGILLQLWKGVIQSFTSDGTPIFPVTCSDGFFQIMKQMQARSLFCAANVLRERATAIAVGRLAGPTEAEDPPHLRLMPVFVLYGYALENLVKGLLVARGADATWSGALNKDLRHHCLTELFRVAGVQIGPEENRLLEDLRDAIESEKYPVGVKPRSRPRRLGLSVRP